MPAVPRNVFGKYCCPTQIVAVIEREEQIAVRDVVVGPRHERVAAALFGFNMSALPLQGNRKIGQNAVGLLRLRKCDAMVRFGLDWPPGLPEQCAEKSVVDLSVHGSIATAVRNAASA